MGEKAFTKVQYGIEETRGTAVASTARWPGTIKVPPDRKPDYPEDATGLRVRSQRSVINQILADGIVLAMPKAVFQKLPFIFSLGMKGGIIGAEVTAGQGDYLWDFSHSLSAVNEPEAATIEYGDDTQAYEIEYCMAKRYTISGKLGSSEPISVEVELFGKQITPAEFTAGQNLLTADLTPMIANMCKIFIDPAWATVGSTQKTGLLREFSIEILTGIHPKFHAEGVKTMTGYGEDVLDCLATFTFEGNAEADSRFDDFLAGTTRAIRFQALGPVIGTGTPHSLAIDMFGTFDQVIPLDKDESGDNLHTAIFQTHSDGLAAPHHFAVKVTTNQNSV